MLSDLQMVMIFFYRNQSAFFIIKTYFCWSETLLGLSHSRCKPSSYQMKGAYGHYCPWCAIDRAAAVASKCRAYGLGTRWKAGAEWRGPSCMGAALQIIPITQGEIYECQPFFMSDSRISIFYVNIQVEGQRMKNFMMHWKRFVINMNFSN